MNGRRHRLHIQERSAIRARRALRRAADRLRGRGKTISTSSARARWRTHSANRDPDTGQGKRRTIPTSSPTSRCAMGHAGQMERASLIPTAVPAREIPAAVRSARRLVEHRRQRLGRHHLLGAALRPKALSEPTPSISCSRAREQVAPATRSTARPTMLVLTVGDGVHGFTLDREIGDFVLTTRTLRIPRDTTNSRSTSPTSATGSPVQRYVDECLAGKAGPRGKDFNMRWIASLVADVHRILTRGGIFMYPRDTQGPAKAGRLRLMYEANPMASSSSRPAARPPPAASASSTSSPTSCTSASAFDLRLARRGRAHRALPRASTTTSNRPPLFGAPRPVPESRVNDGETHVSQASHHRDHRLVRRRHHLGHAHLRAHLPPRGRSTPPSSRATASTATTAPR